MTRMLPISLIILGGIILIAGISLLLKTPKPESLNRVISVVSDDGILTPKEEKQIREVAKSEGKDGDVTITQIRKDLEESEERNRIDRYQPKSWAGFREICGAEV